MPRKKAGIQGKGLERLRKNLEELQDLQGTQSWVVGTPSEKDKKLGEEIAQQENNNLLNQLKTQRVLTLPDLWPSKDNYYKGPYQSTRVSAHRFVPNRIVVPDKQQLGTVYVQFTNMRPNGKIRREDVYAYYDVPINVYYSFAQSTSKGQFINNTLDNYEYKNLNKEKRILSDFD